MSIIPPQHPAPPPHRTVDEVGRQVKICNNCGHDIVRAGNLNVWCHPHRGYSALCYDVKRGTPT